MPNNLGSEWTSHSFASMIPLANNGARGREIGSIKKVVFSCQSSASFHYIPVLIWSQHSFALPDTLPPEERGSQHNKRRVQHNKKIITLQSQEHGRPAFLPSRCFPLEDTFPLTLIGMHRSCHSAAS